MSSSKAMCLNQNHLFTTSMAQSDPSSNQGKFRECESKKKNKVRLLRLIVTVSNAVWTPTADCNKTPSSLLPGCSSTMHNPDLHA